MRRNFVSNPTFLLINQTCPTPVEKFIEVELRLDIPSDPEAKTLCVFFGD